MASLSPGAGLWTRRFADAVWNYAGDEERTARKGLLSRDPKQAKTMRSVPQRLGGPPDLPGGEAKLGRLAILRIREKKRDRV
jgi:hypothetical protein